MKKNELSNTNDIVEHLFCNINPLLASFAWVPKSGLSLLFQIQEG